MLNSHEEMMKSFISSHGELLEYDSSERDMYMGWLGNFVLGWGAAIQFLSKQQEELRIEEIKRMEGMKKIMDGRKK